MKLTHLLLATAIVALPVSAFAAGPKPTKPQTINQRKGDQQKRIAQGVKSGQLTPGETSRIEHQEQGINREEAGMREQDNGHLTAQDRKTINSQQNKESQRIYNDKHNDHTDPGVPPAPKQ